jgi:chromosome segregation ATPase
LLWLPAKQASQVLAGAGVFLERLATIWLEGAAAKDGLDAELVDRLVASCHRLERDGLKHQLWRLDGQRLVERELLLVSQQREGLQVRVEELERELSAQGAEQSRQREMLLMSVQELQGQLSVQTAQKTEQSQQREVLQARMAELQGQYTALSMERDQLLQSREALQNQVHEQQERFDRINFELNGILALID